MIYSISIRAGRKPSRIQTRPFFGSFKTLSRDPGRAFAGLHAVSAIQIGLDQVGLTGKN
jgi:hypothetical protein